MLKTKKDVVTSLLGLGGTVEQLTNGLTLVTHNSSTMGKSVYVLSTLHDDVIGAGADKDDLINNLQAGKHGHVALWVKRGLPDFS